ncbi:MAG: 4Fe-4S dicluster domain-containing protein [Acetobacteraceae bacterium]|nr:4Fe-4S dicluster domain-containing protein [Acetobacteraceae bacterium]
MPTRELNWNISLHLLIYLFVAVAAGFMIYGLCRRFRVWLWGKRERRLDRLGERLKTLVVQALVQRRVASEAYPGTFHLALFWGFLVLFLGTLVVLLQADFGVRVLYGRFYLFFSLILDLAGLPALLGCLLAAWRRYIARPSRLDNNWDDAVTLLGLFLTVVTGYLLEGLRIAATDDPWAVWSPVGLGAAWIFRAAGAGPGLERAHAFTWWGHMALGVGLCAYLPYSKLFHVLASPANQFFRSLRHPGALLPLDLEGQETFGVTRVEEFTWKQLFDTDACTRCGRCQDHCPAHLSEKPLSPKKFTQDLKAHLWKRAPALLSSRRALRRGGAGPAASQGGQAAAAGGGPGEVPAVVGEALSEDALWSCTTCRSCEEHCPVFVEQVGKIVDLRRALVLMEGRFPPEAQRALRNVETNYNPWGVGFAARADWGKDLSVRVLEPGGSTQVLLWVGCAGAFDARNQKVARALARALQAAGVEFATLGTAERCCGDSARRIGNEYLFQTLAKENVEALGRVRFERILTACPHCYNALKNEYPDFGGRFQVVHHSQYLAALVAQGRLKPAAVESLACVYHDSCYLARYNGVVAEPRRALRAVPGLKPLELRRSRRHTFCCGAGGGRMWMEEKLGKRINELRAQQAVDAGADLIATACPFCLTMLEDGLKAKGLEEKVRVADLAEILGGSR